uniref:Uncharacterized protein n=1 Tax=Fagus sylvatica TaxID=28930 RepID=A0A2N9HUC4_FAGSY
MREPRYPLPRVVLDKYKTSTPARTSCPRRPATLFGFSSLAHSAPGFGLRTRLPRSLRMVCGQTGGTGFPRPFGDERPRSPSPRVVITRSRVVLLGQVQWTSRDVAGSEPPTSPRSEHFTGPFNRQITPPTKNGHAPPPIESRKSSQSVNPYYVWTWINQVAFLFDADSARHPSDPRDGRVRGRARRSFVSSEKACVVRCTSTEPAKPYNLNTTHMPSRTLDHNTTKRTTACQASRLDKHEEASSSAKSAPLGMKTQATSLESIHRRDNMFNLDDFQHFAAGGHRRPPPPVVVVVVPITLTTHPLNTCKLACGMHMWGGGHEGSTLVGGIWPAEAMPRHGLARPRHVMPRQCHGYQGMGCPGQGMCCHGCQGLVTAKAWAAKAKACCCQGNAMAAKACHGQGMCCQGMPQPRHVARHAKAMPWLPRHATAKACAAKEMPWAAKACHGQGMCCQGNAMGCQGMPRPRQCHGCQGMPRPRHVLLRLATAKAMPRAAKACHGQGMGCQQLERNPQL